MSAYDRQKLAAARLWAATRYPYLASALFAMNIHVVDGLGTVAVDEHWRLYVDPFVIDEWSVDLLGSVLVHHSGHLLREHADRARALGLGKDDAKDWTLAADAEINDDLVEERELPGEVVTPGSLGLEPGRFAEEYFEALRGRVEEAEAGDDENERHGSAHDCGSGADAHQRDYEEPGDGGLGTYGAHLLRCQVASEILQHCKGMDPGTVPAGWKRWAEEMLDAKVDWRRALAAEIRQGINSVAGAVDYSYAKPSRRQSVLGKVVMPALRKPVPQVAVVVDTSGSMNELLLARAIAEVQGILRSVGIGRDGMRLISCDAAVNSVQRISSVKNIELYGGGGTNMGEGIAAASTLKPRPSVVVVLTDGYTPWPASPPKGVRIVIGVLEQESQMRYRAPAWAKVIQIEDVA